MTTTKRPLQISGESAHWERFRLDCASLTAAGVGRGRNEDHCVFAAPGAPQAEQAESGYLFAVIDGDSEGGQGRSAARETGTSLLEVLDDPRRNKLRPDLMLHRLNDANDRCHEVIEGRCAVTAVWIWEEPATASLVAAWAHVGDTRLYRHGRDGWKRLTKDHAKGRILDRAIGQGPGLLVDTGPPGPGQRRDMEVGSTAGRAVTRTVRVNGGSSPATRRSSAAQRQPRRHIGDRHHGPHDRRRPRSGALSPGRSVVPQRKFAVYSADASLDTRRRRNLPRGLRPPRIAP